MLSPKVMLQELWNLKLRWDDEVPEEYKIQFKKWCEQTKFLSKLKIPRNMANGDMDTAELHMFSDGSKLAYATVIYLKTNDGSNTKVQLVQAKSRVAPLKKITIPRLELLGCVIGSRLLENVKTALKIPNSRIFCWTDSTTALSWIKTNDNWGTFVGNRVKEICEKTSLNCWRFVPGHINPADLPSRGCSPKVLKDKNWNNGPEWLYKEETWPKQHYQAEEEKVNAEKRKTMKSLQVTKKEELNLWKYSSYWKNVKVMAYVKRFIAKVQKRSSENGQLTVDETELAELEIWKLVQRAEFPKVGGEFKGLQLMEVNGVWKVKTKLLHRPDKENFRLPILLPTSHPLVQQYVYFMHKQYCHAGIQFLLGKIREKFWIIKGRQVIRKIVRSCVTCRRFAAKPVDVPVTSLPLDRVADSTAFQITGIDLCGPVYLKGNDNKAWIVLFTCAVYRGIHLEIVKTLTTNDFILALTRFISRRGRPDTIYSDNGTNFQGAANLFQQINWELVQQQTQTKQIKWKFIPVAAPWWGGWWERLIRSLKDLLRRMLGNSKLSYVEMETCLCELEAIMNSRPLTYVTEDPEDLIPLTPSMFMQTTIQTVVPELDNINAPKLRKQFSKLKKLREELKGRFRSEYLGMLVQRGKEKKFETLHIGEAVLVVNDQKKRMDWIIATIEELVPGRDGVPRMAWIRTKNGGRHLRPVQRLVKLEVQDEVSKELACFVRSQVLKSSSGTSIFED